MMNQNGEYGATCSTACTDGLVRVLRAHGNCDRSKEVLRELEEANENQWRHGAQFVTEIQGGSDAATNAVQAEECANGQYAIYGEKWFCSNFTADYWLVTARVDPSILDHRGIGLFLVPRNQTGWKVERLKDKLGTRALPTGEIVFSGAKGWPIGDINAGLKTMVAVVLITSRIHNIVASAGFVKRAYDEAWAYANFRHAFGRPLKDHPLIKASLATLGEQKDHMAAGAFATIDAWIHSLSPHATELEKHWARVLISIAKAVSTRNCNSNIYEAMMVLGANGIEERFTALPRLWRDSAILETWEGPYTLLLMQALGDLQKYKITGREQAFLEVGLGKGPEVDAVAESLASILSEPSSSEKIVEWKNLANRIYRCFQKRALLTI